MAASYTTNDASYTVPLIIDGKECETDSTFPVISPESSKTIWHCSSAGKADVSKACSAARNASYLWSKTKPAFRRNILLRAADLIEQRKDELVTYMMLETGAKEPFSAGFNIPLSCEILRDLAGRISSITGSVPESEDDGTSAMILKEPYGVVLAIAPWNAPYILGFRSVVYPIAAGNTCILKGSELSPRCFWAIGSILADAGLPPGVLNVVYHSTETAPEITNALIADAAVKKINFTGSTRVGSIIASTAGKLLKPVLMELGGKGNAIVLEDANIDQAAKHCVFGSFLNSGQICMITERILVHENVAEDFKQRFEHYANEMYGEHAGTPVLITPDAVLKARGLVNEALAKGARVVWGRDPSACEETTVVVTTRMAPVAITGVTRDMQVWDTETFGPTVSIVVVKSEDEAVKIANQSAYGLNSAVFTEDLRAGLRVARNLETGAVHINSATVHDEASLPHGGCKSSGWGRFNASAGLEEFLRTKTITWQDG